MMKRSTLILPVLVLALSLVSGGPAGFAQDKKGKGGEAKQAQKKKKPTEEDKLAAKSYTEKGMGLYNKGDYEGALAYLLKADELIESSVNLFYIAKCCDILYKFRDAYEYYLKYIDTGEKSNYDAVIEAIARIESMPVILKIVTTPEGAGVTIDGEEVTFQKTPVVSEVEAGKHTVLIKKDGFKDVVMNVDIPFAGTERIDVEMLQIDEPAVFPDKTKGKEKGKPKETPKEQPKETAKQKETVQLTPSKEAVEKLKMKQMEEAKKEEAKKKKEQEKEKDRKKAEAAKAKAKAKEEKERKKAEAAKEGAGGAKHSIAVPMTVSLAAGATVSTTKRMGSYIDASLGIFFRIKEGFVGLGLDNLFFTDGYLLAGYPAGGYTLKVWRDLSLSFTAGFGAAYLQAFADGGDADGNILIEKGSHWDLVVHADIRLRYRVGPVILQAIPACADVLIGAGNITPAPLAQFAFLLGVAFDF